MLIFFFGFGFLKLEGGGWVAFIWEIFEVSGSWGFSEVE